MAVKVHTVFFFFWRGGGIMAQFTRPRSVMVSKTSYGFLFYIEELSESCNILLYWEIWGSESGIAENSNLL